MCYAIIEVKYRAATSPNEIIKFNDEAALEQRLATLQAHPIVCSSKSSAHTSR